MVLFRACINIYKSDMQGALPLEKLRSYINKEKFSGVRNDRRK